MSRALRTRIGACLGVGAWLWALGAHAEPVDGTRVASAAATPRRASYKAAVTVKAADAKPQEEPSDGIFDPLRIGAFGGVGFPRPLSIEGFLKIEKVIGFGVEYSTMPSFSISGVDTSLSAIAGDLRVFPLSDGFFIGIAAGHQHLGASPSASLQAQLQGMSYSVSGDTWFLNPRIGYLSTWSWGGTLGIDVGVQIPVATQFTNTIPTAVSAHQDADNISHTLGASALPTINLLRLGLLL